MSGRTWLRRHARDLVSPRARARRTRPLTRLVVVHRFDVTHVKGCPSDVLESIPWFFQEDPEGVATVTLGGSYASKVSTIHKWREEGIPPDLYAKAFPAYHFGIRADGELAQYLPLEARGAHAGGLTRYGDVTRGVNGVSVAVALLGDFRRERPTQEMEKTLREVLRELFLEFDDLEVMSHTESNAAHGVDSRKQCPGLAANQMLERCRRWGEGAARIINTPDRW